MRKYKRQRRRYSHNNVIFLFFVLLVIGTLLVIHLGKKQPERKPKKITLPFKKSRGEIAFVIDDWGYQQDNLNLVRQIRYPLTMAILPNLAYSSTLARELHTMGFEIILHLPMEPYEKYNLEENTLLLSMDEFKIRRIIQGALRDVGYCRGVSNHMGSRLTSDPKTMKIIFEELKKSRLYFLDSFVTSSSICFNLANKMDIDVARRDIFLDNRRDVEYIKGQIYKLKKLARLRGKAIGIGHNRKITLEILKEIMPRLEEEGYSLVFVSDLIH